MLIQNRAFCCLAAGALMLLATANSATAQPQEDTQESSDSIDLGARPAPDTARTRATGTVLEELVVTATPTGDTLADTPISVSIASDQELRQTNITDVEVLSDRLPNAQLALTPTNTFLFVRGLGTGSVRSAEQSVGFFVDGVYLGRPQVALFDFLDVDQVELLRGPQGAILGKNTVAGAVNVRTAPATFAREGYIEALAGSDDKWRARGALSGALSDSLAGRVAYTQSDQQGYLYNTTQQRFDLARPGRSGRAKLLWSPDDDARYAVSVQAARIRQVGDSFELSQASEESLRIYRLYDPEVSTDITDNRTHTDHRDSGALIEGQDVFFHADHTLESGRLRLVLAHSQQDADTDFDLDISPAPLLTIPSLERYRQHSAELRFDHFFKWGDVSAGLLYFSADLDLKVDITLFENGSAAFVTPLLDNATGAPVGSLLQQGLGRLGDTFAALPGGALASLSTLGSGASLHRLIQQQSTYSAFASSRWNITDRWTLRLDGRITRERKDADQSIVFEGVSGQLLGRILGEQEYSLIASHSETNISPRLSLLTQINDQLNSYVTLARGFKSGGFNNLAAVPERAEFDDEHSQTYEAGLRLRTDFGLRGELGLFHTRFDNLQVAALDGTEFFVGNAAKAHTQGIEMSLQWSWRGLLAGAQLGYLDARYDDYRNAPSRADQDEDSQDLSGRTLQRAPRYSGSVQLTWLTSLPWIGLPCAIGGVAEGASHQFLNIDLDPIDSQPGYLRYSAFIGVEEPASGLSLRLIGRNLANKTVRREAADIAIVGAHSVGVYPPRSVAAELAWRF